MRKGNTSSRVSLVELSTRFLAFGGTSSDLQTLCGFIHMPNRDAASFATRPWRITVHNHLYLNLTFLELVLSMPYGRCDLSQGSEHLLICDKIPSLELILKEAVFLCGVHSSFSMIWRDSPVLLLYIRVPSIIHMGQFLI